MKDIKKALLTDKIYLSRHSKMRMAKRGYTKKDLIMCILSGSIAQKQVIQGRLRVIVEGFDTDRLPMVIVIGRTPQPKYLAVITVMPPMTNKFKRVI